MLSDDPVVACYRWVFCLLLVPRRGFGMNNESYENDIDIKISG